MKLNIGCGKDIKPGYLNCDYKLGIGVGRVFDASKSFPFDDSSCEEVYISHVLEHIFNWPETLLECHRVLKLGGQFEIRVPYGIGWHNSDPHHVRFFSPGTMDLFTQQVTGTTYRGLDLYSQKPMFKLIKLEVRRIFWFGWHLEHYLGIKWLSGKRYRFPIGRKAEIRWILEKI